MENTDSVVIARASRYLHDVMGGPLPLPTVARAENGWYRSQMPLEFDGYPVGKVVEQWLSKVRGALHEPDARVLITGCMKRNVDPSGQYGLANHPRIIWWESHKKNDNSRAATPIPSRVTIVFALRFISHPLSGSIKTQAEQRGIVNMPILHGADVRKLLQFGFMDGNDLERRLKPQIPSAIAKMMEYGSTTAVATTKTLIDGQIHRLVQGDALPAPLEPVAVLPTIYDAHGAPMKKADEVVTTDAPKKKRIIVNKAIGPIQAVLMANEDVSLDRTLSFTERARRLIDKCRDAGRDKTTIESLALAVGTYQRVDDAKTAKTAEAAAVPPAAPAVEPVTPAPVVVTTPVPASPAPPPSGAIARIRAIMEQQRAELQLAEEHVSLARIAQSEIEDLTVKAIDEARGDALRALEQTLASMRLA